MGLFGLIQGGGHDEQIIMSSSYHCGRCGLVAKLLAQWLLIKLKDQTRNNLQMSLLARMNNLSFSLSQSCILHIKLLLVIIFI